jgi:hypothetical protein
VVLARIESLHPRKRKEDRAVAEHSLDPPIAFPGPLLLKDGNFRQIDEKPTTNNLQALPVDTLVP